MKIIINEIFFIKENAYHSLKRQKKKIYNHFQLNFQKKKKCNNSKEYYQSYLNKKILKRSKLITQ